jgi:hypothetical protein
LKTHLELHVSFAEKRQAVRRTRCQDNTDSDTPEADKVYNRTQGRRYIYRVVSGTEGRGEDRISGMLPSLRRIYARVAHFQVSVKYRRERE